MGLARSVVGRSMACALLSALPIAATAAQPDAPPEPPTAIEEAIIEHACGSLHPAGSLETPAYLECRQNQLLSLRNDFGRDLRRLSTAQRRTIDAACSALRAPQGQDAYVECLVGRLVAFRPRAVAGKPDAPAADVPASPAVAIAAPSAADPVAPPASRSWILATILTLVAVAAGGGAFFVMKARRASGVCKTCGVKLVEQGDLCQKCRHEAAEARRRATAERADEERIREGEQRRQAAREEEERQQRTADEAARRRQLEEAEQRRLQQQEEEAALRREDEARHRRESGVDVSDAEFEPYAVLAVATDASAADIEAAYVAAKKKYDPDLVADMGAELQEHFRRKGQAVERAYQMLANRPSP